ncbi:MAG: serine/threonine-protein kinase [Myxococcales bacterium]
MTGEATVGDVSVSALLGRVLSERYRLISLIGQGGSSLVFVAEHVRTKRRFALKLMSPDLITRGPALQRFRAEAELAGAIVNDHVVTIVDYDDDGGTPYLVMELLHGRTLRNLLGAEGALDLPRALSLMLQCCDGVQAAHARGLVHRDLKPENLFLCQGPDGSERIKVLDFGVAKSVLAEGNGQTKPGTLVGTTRYMAPEQLKNASGVDARADVYALGIILYEMLSGKPAFKAGELHAEIQQVLFERPTPLARLRADLPPSIAACVASAMAHDLEARTASVLELRRALEGLRFLRSTTAITPADEPAVSLLQPAVSLPQPAVSLSRSTVNSPRPPLDSLHDVVWRPADHPRTEPDAPTLREVARRSFGILRLSAPLLLATLLAALLISLMTCLPR